MSELDVLLVFRDARPAAGGLGIDLRDIANGLSGRGHNVGVITVRAQQLRSESAYQFIKGVDILELDPVSPKELALRYGLAPGVSRLIGERPNVLVHVFSCMPVYLHLAAMAAARRARRPLFWTPMLHPSRRQLWRHYGVAGRAMRWFDELAPRMARFVDAIGAATEAEAEQFRRLGCKRVEILPPSVSDLPPASDSAARSFRNDIGVGNSPLVLVVAGRAERRKGVGFALDAFCQLRQQLPEARLLLVGGDRSAALLPDGVHPVERLSDSDLKRAFRAADVTFVPSRFEAFSRVVIEAWQQERPVVVTDGVALAETVQSIGGRVVPFGDAETAAGVLGSFLDDPQLADQVGKAGRGVVQERFLVHRLVEKTESLYEELCMQ
jgi:D-inositol-3-phosphate glycosyltransferase